jgi:4-amino-4-deoxy-L-arabinose transferase-like glycosyltransferase
VSTFTKRLLLILAGALAVRLVYTIVVPGNAYSPGHVGDTFFFHEIANLLADGEGFAAPFAYQQTGAIEPTAEHPPLWPLLLAATSELGGTGILSHRLTGVPVGVATVGVLGLIGRRVGGDAAGLMVAAIAAAHPLFIAADGSLMSETLYGLFVAASLLLALQVRDHPSLPRVAALGAAIGLATLTRGEGVLLLVLLVVVWRRPRWLVAGLAAAALVVAPWTIRNLSTFEKPVLVSTNDGTVLTGANCHRTYHGRDLGFWRTDCRSKPTEDDESEQSATWRDEGLDYMGGHAGRLVVVVPVRVLRTWGVWQPVRQTKEAEGRDRTTETLGVIVYFVLLPAAVYGAILLRRTRAPLWVLMVPPILVTLVSATAYGYTRFRHGADLVIVVLAGLALAELLARRRASGT